MLSALTWEEILPGKFESDRRLCVAMEDEASGLLLDRYL